jgi:hypothetical protein
MHFFVESDHLLGLIVSNFGIRVDPLKVEEIIDFPPPKSIIQLQGLQGKEKFLRRFVSNYAKITKGFMRLLKKGCTFYLGRTSPMIFQSFEAGYYIYIVT